MDKSRRDSHDRERQRQDHFGDSSSDYTDIEAGINYDFDWNTDYGDGDIPDIDEPY